MSTEVSRGKSAENSLELNLSTEVSRAKSAESVLTTDVSIEVSRSKSAEKSLEVWVGHAFSGDAGYILSLQVSTDVTALGSVFANAFITTSDVRLKKDIAEVSNALEMVNELHPVLYNWVDERPTINPGHKELGFLAQEVEAVIPNIVRTTQGDGLDDKKVVAYDRLVALLVGAVKELKAEVDALKRA